MIGALTADGQVDVEAVRALVAAAEGREVTFHRAIDVVEDVTTALDVLVELGVTRVLTSGGAARSIDGSCACAPWPSTSRVACRSRRAGSADPGRRGPGGRRVDAVHLSAKRILSDDGGPGGGGGSGYDVTDLGVAREARSALDAARVGRLGLS
ncbi:copper homeostasis protein CutC [Oerskovia sp. M15]